jgi:hypothetical protein
MAHFQASATMFALYHIPGQIVVLGTEILQEVPGYILASLEVAAEQGGGKMGHA